MVTKLKEITQYIIMKNKHRWTHKSLRHFYVVDEQIHNQKRNRKELARDKIYEFNGKKTTNFLPVYRFKVKDNDSGQTISYETHFFELSEECSFCAQAFTSSR